MKWINVKDELPKDGEFVFTYRPMAKESGDQEFIAQNFISKDHKNTNPQGVVHGFDTEIGWFYKDDEGGFGKHWIG